VTIRPAYRGGAWSRLRISAVYIHAWEVSRGNRPRGKEEDCPLEGLLEKGEKGRITRFAASLTCFEREKRLCSSNLGRLFEREGRYKEERENITKSGEEV